MATDRKLLETLKKSKERVIAENRHKPTESGMKGHVEDFDDLYIQFRLFKSGKLVLLPISSTVLIQVTKRGPGHRD